jgi:thiol-disulfide isomerase/thioredoxin
MKHLKYYLTAAMLLWHPSPSSATKTILCGHFVSNPEKTMEVQFYVNPIDMIEHNPTHIGTEVDASGNFKISFDIANPVRVNFMSGENWLFINKFIAAGDSLFLTLDTSGTKIEGSDEDNIGSMFAYDNIFITQSKIKEEEKNLGTMTDIQYARYWSDKTDSSLAFYKKYRSSNHGDAGYAAAVDYELKYDGLYHMVRFGWRGAKGNNEIFNNPEFMHYFTRYSFDDEGALVANRYIDFLDDFTSYLMEPMGHRYPRAGLPSDFYERQRIRDSIARHYFSGKVYDIALYAILYSEIQSLSSRNGDSSFQTEYTKTEKSIHQLGKGFKDKSLLARLKEKLRLANESGKPAHDFAAKTLDGKTVKLSDLKGKVVYVDVWATNCAPCVQEVPHSKKLQQKYAGKDVVFLNVSLDNSTKTLESFIRKHELTGLNTIDSKGFASDVAKLYHITGIPRYILVNKDGTVVSSDAPRPSSNPDMLLDMALEK